MLAIVALANEWRQTNALRIARTHASAPHAIAAATAETRYDSEAERYVLVEEGSRARLEQLIAVANQFLAGQQAGRAAQATDVLEPMRAAAQALAGARGWPLDLPVDALVFLGSEEEQDIAAVVAFSTAYDHLEAATRSSEPPPPQAPIAVPGA